MATEAYIKCRTFFLVGAVGAQDFKSVIPIKRSQTAIFKEDNQRVFSLLRLRFSLRFCWRCKASGLLRRIDW